jgi:hypothetical protein
MIDGRCGALPFGQLDISSTTPKYLISLTAQFILPSTPPPFVTQYSAYSLRQVILGRLSTVDLLVPTSSDQLLLLLKLCFLFTKLILIGGQSY